MHPVSAAMAMGLYAQLVYAGHATDVTDVMVNGKWLMRDRQLLTLNENELLAQAARICPANRSIPDRAGTIGAVQADCHWRRDRR